MKHLHIYILSFILPTLAQHAFSQWYFETGVNDAKFTKYDSNNPTILNSYSGLRDFSHGFGYIFPAKNVEERAAHDGKAAALRFRVGLGFDQMGLRLKATKSGSQALHHYDFGQLQGRLGVLFTPTLVRKKQPDSYGVRQSAIKLILDAGVSYNLYTSATRTLINGTGDIKNLKDDSEFEESYPAYTFGAGFEFPINRHTSIYARYDVENAFSNKEGGTRGVEEIFSTYKQRASIGLRVDFKLKNHMKAQQLDRIAALEADDTEALDALNSKVAKLENTINSMQTYDDTLLKEHIHNNGIHHNGIHHGDIERNGAMFEISEHKNGFSYFPAFKHVLFSYGSSFFDNTEYASKLSNLALFLKQNANYRIKLVGYADAKTGTSKYNKTLSANRAKRVYDYLKDLGVPTNRMEHTSSGGTLKFNINKLSENRRTEILIFE